MSVVIRYTVSNYRGNSQSGSGAGPRTTGVLKALTENAPMARKVRKVLGNMMIGCVVRENRQQRTRPEVW